MTSIRNRIVGYADVAPGELKPHPMNPRLHPPTQRKALTALLDQVGWVRHVLVNQRTGYVLDGHLRIDEALDADEPTVPVLYVDLDDHEERLALALFDAVGLLALTDAEALTVLLEDAQTDAEPLVTLLDQVAADAGIGLELVDDDDEDRSSFDPSPVTAQLGELRIPLDRETFERWRNDLYRTVGFEERAIIAEIRRRLGL